jgi:hypothetical protein
MLDEAVLEGTHLIDTDELTPSDVADQIADLAGWNDRPTI